MDENRTTETMLRSAEFSTNATVENNACGENSCLNKGFSGKRAVEDGEVSVGNSATQDGSICGKFKDVASLKHSYESLQSAFTQKCQQVAKLEKDLLQKTEEIASVENANVQNAPLPSAIEKLNNSGENLQNASENGRASVQNNENSMCQTEKEINQAQNHASVWSVETVHAKVAEFVQQNPMFAGFEESLLTTALSNPNFLQNEHFMKQVSAYTLGNVLLTGELVLPKNLCKTLAQNKSIQKEVISSYIAELNQPTLPHVMTSKQGTFSAKSVYKAPNSIQEAGKLAQSLFNE